MTAGRLTDLERPAHPRTRSDHPRCPLHLRRLLLDPTAVRVCIHAYTPEPSGVPGLRMPVQPPGVRTDALTHSVRAHMHVYASIRAHNCPQLCHLMFLSHTWPLGLLWLAGGRRATLAKQLVGRDDAHTGHAALDQDDAVVSDVLVVVVGPHTEVERIDFLGRSAEGQRIVAARVEQPIAKLMGYCGQCVG